MNVMLVSPVDALVFEYVGFGIFTLVNNLWTWVAVITAAISFWRFKTDKTKPICMDRVDNKDDQVETRTFKCFWSSYAVFDTTQTNSDSESERSSESNMSTSNLVQPDSSLNQNHVGTTFKRCGLESEAVSSSGSSATLASNCAVKGFEDNIVTKGKFVTYYYEECLESVNECGNGDETALNGVEWWPERLLMRMEMEDMGWYSYQDLTVVNGNVVRLWDGSVRKEKLGYRSGCVVW